MKNKKIIAIVAGAILVTVVVLSFVFLNNSESISELSSKCGDGICDEKEQTNPSLCPEECKTVEISGNRFGVFPSVNPIDILESAEQLGIQKTRFILSWEKLEPKKNHFDFSLSDIYINKHYEAGIMPVVTIKSDSSWGTRGGYGDFQASLPLNLDDYEKFIRTVVGRYKDKVKYWQIENEVYENSRYWDGSKEEYIKLLKRAYTVIKEVDPDAKIVLQGFANMMFIEIDNGNKSAIDFFNYIMSKGDYFDAIDFHQYFEPETVYMEIDILKKALATYGYNKPIICTEAGGLDLRLFGQQIRHMQDPSISNVPIVEKLLLLPSVSDKLQEILLNGLSEEEWIDFGIFLKTNIKSRPILEKYQAENLVKRISLTFGQGVEFINWFAMTDFEKPKEWFFSHLGLVDVDRRKKPHYYTYKLLIDKLEGFERADEISFFDSKIVKFTFADKKTQFILWSEGKETIIDLSSHISTPNVKITHFIIELDGNNNPIYPPEKIVPTKSIPLSETPIFIEEIIKDEPSWN